MAAARALDLLLGGVAANGDLRRTLPSALALGTHTLAVTMVSRHETQGGSPWAPLSGLVTTTALAWSVTARRGTAQGRETGPWTGPATSTGTAWLVPCAEPSPPSTPRPPPAPSSTPP